MAVKPKFFALSIPLAIFLLASAPLHDGKEYIEKFALFGVPLHITPFDETVEITRGFSYQSFCYATLPMWNMYYAFIENNDTPAVRYMTGEMMRQAMISRIVFNSSHVSMLENILKDAERTRLWLKSRNKRRECLFRMYEENDRSPEIGTNLIESLHEAERCGFEKWSSDVCESIADYFFAISQNETAFRYLQRGYDTSLDIGSNVRASHLAGRIGEYYRRKGDFEKARDAFSQSLLHARQIDDHYNIARALSLSARLKASLGDFIGAEKLLLESVEECGFITDPICELQKVYLLAELYNSFGHVKRAASLTERVILLADKNFQEFGAPHIIMVRKSLINYIAYSHSLLAQIQLKQGEIDEAVVTMEQALKKSKHFLDRFLYAELEKAMSEAYMAAARLQEASRAIDNSLKLARTLKNGRLEAECLVAFAEVRIAQGELDDADDLLAEAEAIAAGEDLWTVMLDTERLRAVSAARRGSYRRALDHYEAAAARFDSESAAILYEEDKHIFAEKMEEIYEGIISIQDEHFNNSDSIAFWAEKYRHRPYGEVCSTPAELKRAIGLTLSERDWIPGDALIIQYVITSDRLILIATDSDRTIHHSLPIDRNYLERQIQEFFETCYRYEENPVKNGGRIREMAENFYAILIGPFSQIIEEKRILCFVPGQPLHRLPLAALIEPTGECRFLVEDKQITISTTLLDIFRADKVADLRIDRPYFAEPLLVGHSEIDPDIHRLYPGLDELPHTAEEIRVVENIVGGCTALRGTDATPSAFLRHAEGSDLIHIATHSITFPSCGGKSALVLSPGPKGGAEDRILQSLVFENDIRNLHLHGTKLVFISSCQSAPGTHFGFGSGAGLAGGFIRAGADAVIATIWPIEDRLTEATVTSFYRELLSGSGDPAEALCDIQRALITQDRLRGTPVARIGQWAPFIAMCSLASQSRH